MPFSSLVIGVDLVRVADIADSIARFGEHYTRRIYTDREIDYCGREPLRSGQRFAARFAAKEATTKLLRVATDALIWHTIEVLRDPGGWCDILLHGESALLARELGISGLAVSMSHEHEYAMATVVAHRAEMPRG